jgi:predicted RNA binding protein YcfA (HicA-like mRNA interferase family)
MKRYKVKEVIKMLTTEGWCIVAQKGSHRQFKHNDKTGKVTINGKPGETIDQEILNSIFKQAGWK